MTNSPIHPPNYRHIRTLQESTTSRVDLCHNSGQGMVVTKCYFYTSSYDDGIPDEGHELQVLPRHKNIVQLLTTYPGCPAPDQYTLVLRYYDGGTLEELLRHAQSTGNHIPEPLLLHIFVSLSYALQHCYKNGLDQGDFDTDNIFLHTSTVRTGFPDVILGDFELAGPVTFVQPGNIVSPWNISFLGQIISDIMEWPQRPPEGWSDFLHDWAQRCVNPDRELRPTVYDLVHDMASAVEEYSRNNAPLRLPDWASEYFANRIAKTAEQVDNALAND